MTEKFSTDIHIHLAGNDPEKGCWFNPKSLHSFGFKVMLKSLGINRKEYSLTKKVSEKLASNISNSTSLKYAVVLAYDWARDENGKPLHKLSNFYTSNDYVFDFVKEKENVFAGASIHPFRKDSLAELNRCHKKGAVLIKWLPVSQNFSPLDKNIIPFYQEMKKLNLPLLCHTGSEGATVNIDKEWNNPEVLKRALDMGLTVIAAHSGMRSSPHDKDYSKTWVSMLEEYPNLYGDIAAIFGFRARKFLQVATNPMATSRMLHGSDWPVPNSPWWFLGRLKIKEILKLQKIKNPLERDIQTKLSLGLERGIFTRAEEILNLTGKIK